MTRLCACGCGASLEHRHPTARFASDACRARGWKARIGYGHQSPAEAAPSSERGVRTVRGTQPERILRALRHAGERGVTRVDFARIPTVDGGEPILNFPARIMDLKAERHRIEVAGKRNRCAVYRLQEEEKRLTAVLEPAPASSTLFDLSEHRARPVSAIGGGDAA